MIEQKLKDAAYITPDPERSLNNLSSFLSENPSRTDELEANIRNISLLFSYSQFLANYSISHPDILFDALKNVDIPPDMETLSNKLMEGLNSIDDELIRSNLSVHMKTVREFKLNELLKITLRDILKKADLIDTMLELSMLADAIIENSLAVIRKSKSRIHGSPANDAFSVISLGKLGGEELNFSSDVDLIFVYGTEAGETSGVMTTQGITVNKISNHEYYCRIGEELTRFLSLNTDSGFAYRVDLRLRPEGQRGDIALALRGYEMYYESWGRAWERAMLLRARPVAGDSELGNNFIEMIRPFVYRKYLDYSSIDEIRRLKTRIDSTFKKGDIKRGYGGIREIEFFAQALQLIYGGREPLLRERSVLKVLHRLWQKALMGQEDYSILSDNYRFLRTLEHRLQQLNDIQTHTIPSGDADLQALARKMGFIDREAFAADLDKRRKHIRNIYDSLFAEQKDEHPLSGTFFNEEFSDSELKEYLADTGFGDVDRAVRNIKSIKDSTLTFQTLRGRRILSEILPVFVDSALKSSDPDTALNYLQSFTNLLSTNESYLDIFIKNRELIDLLTYVFTQSNYLSNMLMARPQYLEMIGWQGISRKSLKALINEIKASVAGGLSVNDAVRLVRKMEEIRLGLMFLQKKSAVNEVMRGLTKTAEAVLSLCMEQISGNNHNMAVIGFGKFGGREITFGSDLDVIFTCGGEVELSDTKAAEKFLKMLISYTKEGIAYRVDPRLRPDGSKGPLVASIESFEKYYSKAAAFWEFQALLKARPVAGAKKTGLLFTEMAKEILISRGREIKAHDIKNMRERIVRELSKEPEGYDIKLGPGGIEDIEFTAQFLQLNNCHIHKRLLVQGTITAVDRLHAAGIMNIADAGRMKEIYFFYRTLESFLRLMGENVLRKDEKILQAASDYMGLDNSERFAGYLKQMRDDTIEITERYLRDS
ncbi:MAG: bifunctional [glutamate--ammonia ligase]-adenylyl-L-tyrosine phosphorylase/[glutamate--ammonia-ligase] adenylyltransferase [Nitrospirota bacterium]